MAPLNLICFNTQTIISLEQSKPLSSLFRPICAVLSRQEELLDLKGKSRRQHLQVDGISEMEEGSPL